MAARARAEPEAEPAEPLLRIVNADATPEEVAAIVAVFAALGTSAHGAAEPALRRGQHRTDRSAARSRTGPAAGGRARSPAELRTPTRRALWSRPPFVQHT